MSAIATAKTVGELAAEIPAATRIFEKLGIDYCCGGGTTLEEACRAAGWPVEQVRDSIEMAAEAARAAAPDRDWNSEPLAGLIEHILDTHHKFTRAELARLGPLFEKVRAAHGGNHPELAHIQAIFDGLAQELTAHLMKEEMVLFPYIVRMEEAAIEHATVVPAPFGTVRNPIAMMVHEHDGAGQALREMRALGNGYSAPPDACASYRALYQALADLEADLHRHIHLENNILFPRAIEMERAR
jgi:regulator of cell morphogenesis and NO signaling